MKDKYDRYRDFLAELSELSKKHKMVISGCGCCGSPFLLELPESALGLMAGYTVDEEGERLDWGSVVRT